MAYETLQDIENCMDNGWSDGLPVIPPYGSLVDEMLSAIGWKAGDVIGEIADQNIIVRAEKAAATAVMAGCKIEYGPLLRSLSQALLDPRFNIGGVEVTTGGAAV
jgi:TRAP-type mannitol/chloroaromatic compound transport system permease large subunit